MKIYVVVGREEDYEWIDSLHRSEEKAKARAKAITVPRYMGSTYADVEEYELDDEET